MKFVITICLTHNLLLPTIWVQPFISKCCWPTLWCDVSSTVSIVFSVCFIIIFNLTQKRTSPLLVGHAKCHCVNKPGLYKQQVWPDWDIWKFLASNFITKDFLCYFEKWHFLGKNCFDFYIWSTCRNLGYFIFHLVTLHVNLPITTCYCLWRKFLYLFTYAMLNLNNSYWLLKITWQFLTNHSASILV